MPSAREEKPKTTPAERQRVLDAFDRGANCLQVVVNNGIARSTAYVLVQTRQVEDKPRGGLRQKSVKVTPAIMISLEDALVQDPTITLENMYLLVVGEYVVQLSLSTISAI